MNLKEYNIEEKIRSFAIFLYGIGRELNTNTLNALRNDSTFKKLVRKAMIKLHPNKHRTESNKYTRLLQNALLNNPKVLGFFQQSRKQRDMTKLKFEIACIIYKDIDNDIDNLKHKFKKYIKSGEVSMNNSNSSKSKPTLREIKQILNRYGLNENLLSFSNNSPTSSSSSSSYHSFTSGSSKAGTEEANRKANEEARRKAEANRKAREEANRKAKEEARRKAEANRKAREEANRKAKAKQEVEEANRKSKRSKMFINQLDNSYEIFTKYYGKKMSCILPGRKKKYKNAIYNLHRTWYKFDTMRAIGNINVSPNVYRNYRNKILPRLSKCMK